MEKFTRIQPLAAVALLLLTSRGTFASSPRAAFQELCIRRDSPSEKCLTEDTISPCLVNMQYAVRGPIVQRADDLAHELEDKLAPPEQLAKFDHVLYTNIGNPHSVEQQPLTWPRQVLALTNLPDEVGIDNPQVTHLFPKDVVERARQIKHQALHDHGTGAYSHSQGCAQFREHIAEFIEKRDGGVKANANDIFMTNGASTGINMILQALLADATCGVMIPIPQYPLYTASIALNGGRAVGYYLDEENQWSLDVDHLEESLAKAKEDGTNVRGFVLINPGNPTGQCLSRKALRNVIRFCSRHNLVMMSDEVYQDNIYDDNAEFVSAKRAAYETGLIDQGAIELVSFHSTSKGLLGECGHRGGYMELVGFDGKVKDHLYKLASSALCPNLDGQIMTDLMVRGPEPGTESYRRLEEEKSRVYESLKRRAKMVSQGLNSIPGICCQPAQGAMYCFPSIDLPMAAIRAAEANGQSPDTLYALSVLENTGICVVPASGFGQKPGRIGFRTTFLPPEPEMKRALELFRKHHEEFCQKYADDQRCNEEESESYAAKLADYRKQREDRVRNVRKLIQEAAEGEKNISGGGPIGAWQQRAE